MKSGYERLGSKGQQMKISIITTTYNIEDTLESVLTQKGDFYLEYIVNDAFSTDA